MRRAKFQILAGLLAALLTLTAFAVPTESAGISIRITPPSGWTNRDANVAITVIDSTGSGFERAVVKGEGDWRDITSDFEQTGGRYEAVLSVSDNCTVTVRITGWDGRTYEESQAVSCFGQGGPAPDISEPSSDKTAVSEPEVPTKPTPPATEEPVTTTPAAATTATTTKPATGGGGAAPSTEPAASKDPDQKEPDSGTALTPDGNMSLADDISSAAPDEKQFVTVTTKNGNYFYLIIDRTADGEDTVHFLNQVDEADLLALMEDGTVAPVACSCTDKCKAGAVNTACELCAVDMTECVGKEPPPEPEPDPDPDPLPDPDPEPKKSGSNGLLVVVLVVALAGGGAVYFLKFKKTKPDTKGSADLDDYDYGDEDEEDDEKEGEDA